MEFLEVTKLSSKGQVVLPEAIRKKMHLMQGVKFIVIGGGDTVILKKIEMPSLARAKTLLERSQAWAKKAGLKPSDVKAAIKRVRSTAK